MAGTAISVPFGGKRQSIDEWRCLSTTIAGMVDAQGEGLPVSQLDLGEVDMSTYKSVLGANETTLTRHFEVNVHIVIACIT